MTSVPADIRLQVIERVYRDCDELEWESLPDARKTRMYERWIAAPDVGQRLSRYMPRDRIRVWLKDGPLKEYQRALNGLGPNASFTRRAVAGPEILTRSLFGDAWEVVPDTLQHKPLRCLINDTDGNERYLIWGPMESLRDLCWRAVLILADDAASQPPVVAIVRNVGQVLAQGDKRRARAVAGVIGCEVAFPVLPIVRKPEGTYPASQ